MSPKKGFALVAGGMLKIQNEQLTQGADGKINNVPQKKARFWSGREEEILMLPNVCLAFGAEGKAVILNIFSYCATIIIIFYVPEEGGGENKKQGG